MQSRRNRVSRRECSDFWHRSETHVVRMVMLAFLPLVSSFSSILPGIHRLDKDVRQMDEL